MMVRNEGTNEGREEGMSKRLPKNKSEKGKDGKGQQKNQGPGRLAAVVDLGQGCNRA